MITVSEAIEILHRNLPDREQEILPLSRAFSSYLAQDITAPEPSPRYTNSAMDGYALRWEDVKHVTRDNPLTLDIIGESKAGGPYSGMVEAGTTVRISTGASLPKGADTVVRMEDTVDHGRTVMILSARKQGQDVRQAGEEFQTGDLLLPKGTQLRTRQLALLASVGLQDVPVFCPPGVALLVTGTELVSVTEEDIKDFQIRDSNTIMLESAVQEDNGIITQSCQVDDSLDSTLQAIEQAAAQRPVFILCSGGVSVGRHDHVKKAAELAGFTELFWRIRQKPGKPLYAARRDNTILFGLPGNPVSAFMCYRHYVRPILLHLLGQPLQHKSVTARTPHAIANHGSRTNFLRVKAAFSPGAVPLLLETSKQGSHMLSSITNADGYIILEPGESLEPGSLKEVYLF